jgi:hypothetical protein
MTSLKVAAARERLYATDRQINFLRKLLDESFAHQYAHGLCLDRHHLERVTKFEASNAIGLLLSAKQRNWLKISLISGSTM